MAESQTGVYDSDVVDFSDDHRRAVTESDQIVAVQNIATTRTITLANGESVVVTD